MPAGESQTGNCAHRPATKLFRCLGAFVYILLCRTMNQPEQYDLFVVGENERKISAKKEENMTNAYTFTIAKEDHTLGNLLRMQLHRDSKVLFAGYRVPHPLKNELVLKVRTAAEISPAKALKNTIQDLSRELRLIEEKLKDEVTRQQNPDNQMFLDM